MDSRILSDLIIDQREALIQKNLDSADITGEFSIHDIDRNMKASGTKYLKRLHTPLDYAVGKLTPEQKHKVFTVLFGRPINTAYAITNVEVLAMEQVIRAIGRDKFAGVVREILSNE